jgi:hypothetical protein
VSDDAEDKTELNKNPTLKDLLNYYDSTANIYNSFYTNRLYATGLFFTIFGVLVVLYFTKVFDIYLGILALWLLTGGAYYDCYITRRIWAPATVLYEIEHKIGLCFCESKRKQLNLPEDANIVGTMAIIFSARKIGSVTMKTIGRYIMAYMIPGLLFSVSIFYFSIWNTDSLLSLNTVSWILMMLFFIYSMFKLIKMAGECDKIYMPK